MLSLPPELISIIISFLPREGLLAFSLVSSGARQHALPSLFGDFRMGADTPDAYEGLKIARRETKNTIRQATTCILQASHQPQWKLTDRRVTIRGSLYSSNHGPVQIFRILEELPNLSDLVFDKYKARIKLSDLALLVQVTQRISLRHLTFSVERGSVASGLPISGPGCLSTLLVSWKVHDEPGNRGKSLAHLFEFLRPSLATLVRLQITDFDMYWKPTDLEHIDFHLWPVCPSVQNFRYKTRSHDTKVLDAISETFPNLTHLEMVFDSYGYNDWGVWTDECLTSLSTFSHLIYLHLSLDFELAAHDTLRRNHDMAWYRRCYLRRFSASKDIAKVCPRLQRIEWLQHGTDDSGNGTFSNFVVLEEAGERVVRPVVAWWMVKELGCDFEKLGGPLPDNMVIKMSCLGFAGQVPPSLKSLPIIPDD